MSYQCKNQKPQTLFELTLTIFTTVKLFVKVILLLILFLQISGFALLSWQIIWVHKLHYQEEVKSGLHSDKEIQLVFIKGTLDISASEFEYRDKMYDIISIREDDHHIIVTAVEDITEFLLLELFRGYLSTKQHNKTDTGNILELIYLPGFLANDLSIEYYQFFKEFLSFDQQNIATTNVYLAVNELPPE